MVMPPQNRRGVLLLVVLALLAIFSLLGVTFVMMTSHARRGAGAIAAIDRATDPPDRLLNQAFAIVARGTNNPASSITASSLLGGPP